MLNIKPRDYGLVYSFDSTPRHDRKPMSTHNGVNYYAGCLVNIDALSVQEALSRARDLLDVRRSVDSSINEAYLSVRKEGRKVVILSNGEWLVDSDGKVLEDKV